jgi:hypothetical protein
MNDRQKVAIIAAVVALTLLGIFWLAGIVFPVLRTETAFSGALPVIIAISVLVPILRGVTRK